MHRWRGGVLFRRSACRLSLLESDHLQAITKAQQLPPFISGFDFLGGFLFYFIFYFFVAAAKLA